MWTPPKAYPSFCDLYIRSHSLSSRTLDVRPRKAWSERCKTDTNMPIREFESFWRCTPTFVGLSKFPENETYSTLCSKSNPYPSGLPKPNKYSFIRQSTEGKELTVPEKSSPCLPPLYSPTPDLPQKAKTISLKPNA